MARKLFLMLFVTFFVVLLHSSSKNVAQTQKLAGATAPVQELAPFSSLSFEIAAPSQSVFSLQPIPVAFKLTNNNNRPAHGYTTIGFGKSPMFVYIKKAGAEKVLLSMLQPIHKFIRYSTVPVAPGELITLGLARYFSGPGTYEIQAVLVNPDETESLESNTVSINVHEPTGANRVAYNLIRNSSYQEFLFSGVEFNKVKDTLETLKTVHPNSPYARNAAFLLGETYFNKRQFAQALANLLRLENDNDFIFAEKVRRYLAEIRRVNLNPQAEDENP